MFVAVYFHSSSENKDIAGNRKLAVVELLPTYTRQRNSNIEIS